MVMWLRRLRPALREAAFVRVPMQGPPPAEDPPKSNQGRALANSPPSSGHLFALVTAPSPSPPSWGTSEPVAIYRTLATWKQCHRILRLPCPPSSTTKHCWIWRTPVTESRPYERVALRGEFIKPFRNTTEIEFKLTRTGDGVSVTWAMAGRNNWIFKAFSLIANMDTMVGKEFEKALVDLKQVAEGRARSSPADAAGRANSGGAALT
jgi:hypothetical protein